MDNNMAAVLAAGGDGRVHPPQGADVGAWWNSAEGQEQMRQWMESKFGRPGPQQAAAAPAAASFAEQLGAVPRGGFNPYSAAAPVGIQLADKSGAAPGPSGGTGWTTVSVEQIPRQQFNRPGGPGLTNTVVEQIPRLQFNGPGGTAAGASGPMLGTDIFSQGLSTLGKLPSLQQLQGLIAGPAPYTAEINKANDPGYMAAMAQWSNRMNTAADLYRGLLGEYLQGADVMAKNQLAAGRLGLDTALGTGRLGLDTALGLGHLGLAGRQEDRLSAEARYKLSPAGRIDALINQWNADPTKAPPALEQEKRIRDLLTIEGQVPGREPLAAAPQAGRGPSAPGAPLSPVGASQVPPGGAGAPTVYPGSLAAVPTPWAALEHNLEQVYSSAHKQGAKGAANPPTIGEFLKALDVAHPGLIRQDPDAVVGWVRNRYGEQNFQDWFRTPNETRLFSEHTPDEEARAALFDLMRERGNPVTIRQAGTLGRILALFPGGTYTYKSPAAK